MKKSLWIGFFAVLVMLLLSSSASAADGVTSNVPESKVIGPEARSITIHIQTSKSWEVISSHTNGRFDKMSGKGNGTVTLSMFENNIPDVSYLQLFFVRDKSTKKVIGGVDFLQLSSQHLQELNAKCHCGSDRMIDAHPGEYSTNARYQRKAVPLNPQADQYYDTRHALIVNSGNMFCWECDAEWDDLFIMGNELEIAGKYYAYQNHDFGGSNACSICGYSKSSGEGTSLFRLEPAQATIARKETLRLTTPDSPNQTYRFTSSKPFVAQVSAQGVVKGMLPGTAVITAKSPQGETARATIRVVTMSLSLNKSNMTITTAQNGILKATLKVKPAGAASRIITWESSNENIATVSQSGVVTPVGPGKAKITAKADSDQVKNSCTVTVKPLILKPGSDFWSLPKTLNTPYDSIALDSLVTGTPATPLEWSITSTKGKPSKVARISSDGKTLHITPLLRPGEKFVLSATGKNRLEKSNCTITLLKMPTKIESNLVKKPNSELLVGKTVRMQVGETRKMTVSFTPKNKVFKELDWHTYGQGKVSVEYDGNGTLTLTGNKPGFVNIYLNSTATTSKLATDYSALDAIGVQVVPYSRAKFGEYSTEMALNNPSAFYPTFASFCLAATQQTTKSSASIERAKKTYKEAGFKYVDTIDFGPRHARFSIATREDGYQRTIMFALRGTDGFADWVNNINLGSDEWHEGIKNYAIKMLPDIDEKKVRVFNQTLPGLLNDIKNKNTGKLTYRFVIAGHSRGGTTGYIFAQLLADGLEHYSGYNIPREHFLIYTFGSPKGYSAKSVPSFPNAYNFENTADHVPDVGKGVVLGSNPGKDIRVNFASESAERWVKASSEYTYESGINLISWVWAHDPESYQKMLALVSDNLAY